MPVIIGTDEAGYGPNLGPLVVTATAWEVPDGLEPEAMWTALEAAITDAPRRGDKRLHVSDSKKVYSSGKSIASLERAVLSFMKLAAYESSTVAELGSAVRGHEFVKDYEAVLGGIVSEQGLPTTVAVQDLDATVSRLDETLQSADIRLLSIKSCIMFAPEFNRRVTEVDSKGKVLSAETLQLVRMAADANGGESIVGWVVCDKHGGRNRYDDVISNAFDDRFVFRLEESGPQSRYRVGDLEFCFRTKAEAIMPVALASMVAKYVREVVMMQFNKFWQYHLPELKPTKGYPQDAARFWQDIEKKCAELGIEKSDIWRCR